MLWFIKTSIHTLFRLFFTLEYYGVENIPKSGPVVLAGNHPSFLDPILISLPVRRKVSFIAWDRLFTIPILGSLLRFFGAFPVNTTRRDSKAFEQAMKVLQNGGALGIFPEAGRSKNGKMNESLKNGAARFAIKNKCPLIPVTITGASDAWPSSRLFPLPRKITVKFYKSIISDPSEYIDTAEYASEVTENLRKCIEQRLVPSLKVVDKLYQLFSRPAWPLRIYELVPLGILFISLFSNVPKLSLIIPVIIFYSYLVLDILFISQGRITKVLRDLALPLLLVVWQPVLVKVVNYPIANIDFRILILAVSTFLIPFYYGSYYDAQRFLRGLIVIYSISLVIEIIWPVGYGLHAGLFSFIIMYALNYRPLHWVFIIVGALLYSLMFGYFARPLSDSLFYYFAAALGVNLYLRVVKFTAHDGRLI